MDLGRCARLIRYIFQFVGCSEVAEKGKKNLSPQVPSRPLPSSIKRSNPLSPDSFQNPPERSQISTNTKVPGFCSRLLLFCDLSKNFNQKNLKTNKKRSIPIKPPVGEEKEKKKEKSKNHHPSALTLLPLEDRFFVRSSIRASVLFHRQQRNRSRLHQSLSSLSTIAPSAYGILTPSFAFPSKNLTTQYVVCQLSNCSLPRPSASTLSSEIFVLFSEHRADVRV